MRPQGENLVGPFRDERNIVRRREVSIDDRLNGRKRGLRLRRRLATAEDILLRRLPRGERGLLVGRRLALFKFRLTRKVLVEGFLLLRVVADKILHRHALLAQERESRLHLVGADAPVTVRVEERERPRVEAKPLNGTRKSIPLFQILWNTIFLLVRHSPRPSKCA